MKIHFNRSENGPEHLVCEAEVEFDRGPLDGLKLVGFAVWRGLDDEAYVTLPSRARNAGADGRGFSYVRSVNGSPDAVKAFERWVLAKLRVAIRQPRA